MTAIGVWSEVENGVDDSGLTRGRRSGLVGRGSKAHWVRIFPGGITGRRLTLPDVELDRRGYR